LSSRGIEADEQEKWDFYHDGPPFLRLRQKFWPTDQMDQSLTEVEKNKIKVVKETGAVEAEQEASFLDKLCQICSDWQHLVTTVARLTRFKQNLVNCHQEVIRSNISKDSPVKGFIRTPIGISKAENDIVTMLQKQSFPETISCLKDQPTTFV
jgi:hypothetical protein